MRSKEEIQTELLFCRPGPGEETPSEYRAGYLQALAWVLDEDVPA